MKLKIASLLGIFLLSAYVSGDAVVELSDSDFEPKLADMDLALVMFYAPWCGHCKRLKPEFEKAAKDLVGEDPPISLAKVDCTEAGQAKCGEHGVSGYPTLKIFRKGTLAQEYNGPREANGITKYMKAMSGPSAKPIKNEEDWKKFQAANEPGVVGFFGKDSTSEMKKAFDKSADALRETVRFGIVQDESLTKTIGDYDEKVVLFRPKSMSNKFEDDALVYEGKEDSTKLKDFVNENFSGLVGYRNSDNAKFFSAENLVVAYFNVDYELNPKGTNYWRNRILKVVSGLKDLLASKNVKFAIAKKGEFQHELDEFGVGYFKGDVPQVCITADKGKNKYVMKDEFSMPNFEKFLQDWVAGDLEAFIKSEEIPKENDGEVIIGVAKNFDEVVTNSGKDALIEFYAPWCGHCKKLAPIYKELAEDLKDEDVDIIKFDATANDVPKEYSVTGFPTLFWVPKDKKDSPVKYPGGREKEDFIKYIAKEATNELKGYDRSGNKKKKDEL